MTEATNRDVPLWKSTDLPATPSQARTSRFVIPIYDALIWEVRKQIVELGLTMEQCDDLSGLQNGYTAKALHPETPSGRRARLETIQDLLDAVYVGGFVLTLRPCMGPQEVRAVLARKLAARGTELVPPRIISENGRLNGRIGKTPIRDFARYAGRRGGIARAKKLSEKRRSAIALKAARARWKQYRGEIEAIAD